MSSAPPDECADCGCQSAIRALDQQIAHLQLENEALRAQQLPRAPSELRWLVYFRAPATKEQVLSFVRDGLAAVFAQDPLFQGRRCATFWLSQEGSPWQAFRIEYVGFNLVGFRTAMKSARAIAQVPAAIMRTTQPPSVKLYRKLPPMPPLFEGSLDELAVALREALQVFVA